MGACIGSQTEDGWKLVGFIVPAFHGHIPDITEESAIKIVPLHDTSPTIETTVAKYATDTSGLVNTEVAGIWIR